MRQRCKNYNTGSLVRSENINTFFWLTVHKHENVHKTCRIRDPHADVVNLIITF
jgi:hypothetical protein